MRCGYNGFAFISLLDREKMTPAYSANSYPNRHHYVAVEFDKLCKHCACVCVCVCECVCVNMTICLQETETTLISQGPNSSLTCAKHQQQSSNRKHESRPFTFKKKGEKKCGGFR